MTEEKRYLTPAELVDRWGGAIGRGTLANWRTQGRGPDFVKFGGRVLYPVARVEAYETSSLKGANDNADR